MRWSVWSFPDSCFVLREELADVPHDFRDALLFLQDVGGGLPRVLYGGLGL